eukprot:128308-Rhodomonas_salina.1
MQAAPETKTPSPPRASVRGQRRASILRTSSDRALGGAASEGQRKSVKYDDGAGGEIAEAKD